MKRLCQCLAPGSLDACVPTVPAKESPQLGDVFTTCNNGCSTYVCGVGVGLVKLLGIIFKRDVNAGRLLGGRSPRESMSVVVVKTMLTMRHPVLTCDDNPDQPQCATPDPPPLVPPPAYMFNVSSTPLSPDQVHSALRWIEFNALSAVLTSFGEDTAGKSQADLIAVAWMHFEARMGNLDLGQVDAAASYPTFEQGYDAWVYYSDRVFPS